MNEDGLFCLCQHFATWYESIKNGTRPDFEKPCEECKNQDVCVSEGFRWQEKILPILADQGVYLRMARQERFYNNEQEISAQILEEIRKIKQVLVDGQSIEKRIADLEKKVQDQPLEIISTLMGTRQKEMSKSTPPHRWGSESQSGEQV